MPRPDPATVLQLLHDCEIPWAIAARWDAGIRAELLTSYAPVPVSPAFDTLAEAVDWLAAEAVRRHPKSAFAGKIREITPGIDDPTTPNTER